MQLHGAEAEGAPAEAARRVRLRPLAARGVEAFERAVAAGRLGWPSEAPVPRPGTREAEASGAEAALADGPGHGETLPVPQARHSSCAAEADGGGGGAAAYASLGDGADGGGTLPAGGALGGGFAGGGTLEGTLPLGARDGGGGGGAAAPGEGAGGVAACEASGAGGTLDAMSLSLQRWRMLAGHVHALAASALAASGAAAAETAAYVPWEPPRKAAEAADAAAGRGVERRPSPEDGARRARERRRSAELRQREAAELAALTQDEPSSGWKLPSALSEDSAPSASLDHLKARAAPTQRGAPPEQSLEACAGPRSSAQAAPTLRTFTSNQ